MRPFVFSGDAHIAEPPDLFIENMPAHLKDFVIHGEKDEKFRTTMIGDNVMIKSRLDFHKHKTGLGEAEDTARRGVRNLDMRIEDMDRDGVDAELVFPSLGLVAQRIMNREAALETARIYNDWAWDYTATVRDRLIPAAILPVQNLDDTLAEFKRVVGKGYAAVMLPPVLPDNMPNYNLPEWDPIFAYAGEVDVPLVFHTGTGNVNIIALRGPGGALFNYTRQMNDSVDVICMLVGGGVLDRNPKAKILFVEHGASWLMGVAERLDEVYQGHAPAVNPKLSRKPSEIIKDQVRCTFQNDIGALKTRSVVGTDALLFATDYPHAEGTFPVSRALVDRMFDDVPDITEQEKEAVLGVNAAKLFARSPLLERIEKRKSEATAA